MNGFSRAKREKAMRYLRQGDARFHGSPGRSDTCAARWKGKVRKGDQTRRKKIKGETDAEKAKRLPTAKPATSEGIDFALA